MGEGGYGVCMGLQLCGACHTDQWDYRQPAAGHAEAAEIEALYTETIIPRLSAKTQVLLMPGVFGCSPPHPLMVRYVTHAEWCRLPERGGVCRCSASSAVGKAVRARQ
jgi:hypothetical protein